MKIKGPQVVRGKVRAPGSKAYTHRALLASLLSPGQSIIKGALDCDDTRRTLGGIRSLGAKVRIDGRRTISRGTREPRPLSQTPIDCGESGATLRFLTAVAGTSSRTVTLTGRKGLADRPMDPLLKAMKQLGVSTRATRDEKGFEVKVRGPLRGGETWIQGDISSQFVSGLLFAAPLGKTAVTINIEGELESRPYVNMSLDVLRKHGIIIEEFDSGFTIPAPQKYTAASHQVPGDFSSAAFLIAGTGTAGGEIRISGLSEDGLEPDSVILKIISQIGLEVDRKGANLTIGRRNLEGFVFDAKNNPDLVPALEVLACFADSSSEIHGVKRLQYKETNRLQTLPAELLKMGAKIQVEGDLIRIEGAGELNGSSLASHHDHRIAMACAIASIGAKGESTIDDAEVISKSYPGFFQDLTMLGVKLNVE